MLKKFFKCKSQAIKYTITEINKQEGNNKDNIRNKLKTVTQQRKSIKTNIYCYKKKIKISKPLARLIDMKRKKTNYQHQE